MSPGIEPRFKLYSENVVGRYVCLGEANQSYLTCTQISVEPVLCLVPSLK